MGELQRKTRVSIRDYYLRFGTLKTEKEGRHGSSYGGSCCNYSLNFHVGL